MGSLCSTVYVALLLFLVLQLDGRRSTEKSLDPCFCYKFWKVLPLLRFLFCIHFSLYSFCIFWWCFLLPTEIAMCNFCLSKEISYDALANVFITKNFGSVLSRNWRVFSAVNLVAGNEFAIFCWCQYSVQTDKLYMLDDSL